MRPALPATLCQRYMLSADVQVQRSIEGIASAQAAYAALIDDATSAAYDELERYCRVKFAPTRFVTRPGDDLIRGADYDEAEEYYDVTGFGQGRIQMWTTRWRPIISLDSLALEATPERRLLTIHPSWLRVDHKLGQISVVPLVGAVAYEGLGFDVWLPMLYGGYLKGVMPQFVRIDYTAGLPDGVFAGTPPDPATDPSGFAAYNEYAEVRAAVGMRAAIDVLHSVPQFIATSGSIDGGSANTMDVASQIDRLQQQVEAFRRTWGTQYAPPRMRFA